MAITDRCIGCGGAFEPLDGPTHAYMQSSPACFAAFTRLLAAEYSSLELMRSVHRLTVDTWAVQHPGSAHDRRAIQSVGLHLARLMLQLDTPVPPAEANALMKEFARHKKTIRYRSPPASFSVTVDEIAAFAGSDCHADKVRGWAEATWNDWSAAHEDIRSWVADHSSFRAPPG